MRFLFSLFLTLGILIVQTGVVFAASPLQETFPTSGVIQSIVLETDPTTGITTVVVALMDNEQVVEMARISQETAMALGLVVLDEDGNPVINNRVLGGPIEIDPAEIIPDQEQPQHPIASALATFFSNVPGLDDKIIIKAHEDGAGFGIIAQALWLTNKLEGNAEIFKAILDAKRTGDYSAFILENGTTPRNWGQLKKAILEEKSGLGIVMSDKEHNGNNAGGNGNGNNNGGGNGINNGGGNGNRNNNGDGNGNGNGNNK